MRRDRNKEVRRRWRRRRLIKQDGSGLTLEVAELFNSRQPMVGKIRF